MFGGKLVIDPEGLLETSDTLHLVGVCGDEFPIFDASAARSFLSFLSSPTDRSQTYPLAGLPAETCYDVWVFADGLIARMGLVEWQSGNPFGALPFGAAPFSPGPYSVSPEIYRRGVATNQLPLSLRISDGSNVSVDAGLATFIGSIRISPDGGSITCHKNIGENRKWGIWNSHNKERIVLKGTRMLSYVTSLYDLQYQYSPEWGVGLNGNENVNLEVFAGRPMRVNAELAHNTWMQANGPYYSAVIEEAIGWNSKTIPSGFWCIQDIESMKPAIQVCEGRTGHARFEQPFANGLNTIYPLVITHNVSPENRINTGKSILMQWAQEYDMLLTAEWFA